MALQRSHWFWGITAMLLCCLISVPSFARDEPFSPPDEPGIVAKWVNRAHQQISNGVLKTSERLDRFFGDERVKEEQDTTQMIAAPMLTLFEGKAVEVACPLTINLALPHLKNRWHLMVETLLQEEKMTDDEKTADDGERDVTVSLRYKAVQQAQRWLSLDAGVKIHTDTILSPFGRIRFRRIFDFDPWEIRLTQFLFWLEDEGWGETSRCDVDRQFGKNLLFRIANQVLWSENSEGVEFSQIYALRWQLSGRRALEFDLRGQGHTRPSLAMDEYETSVIFRRRLYKNWIFSEIKPGLRALRDDDFDWTPFIVMKIEWIFGKL